MADLSAIKLPNGATYTLKDNNALPLTGGSVTGPVSFGDSVSIDEATVGDLVVNGGASFTNNIQANTINGVAVGSNPKFTDTVTTISTTGSGNAITAISASNGAITATKGTTFLTAHNTYTVSTTGSGNAVTAISLSGTTFTVTKGTTFLTSLPSHNHSQIITVGDQRSTATTPNSYSNALIFQGLKNKTTIGSPSNDTYSYLIGLRGWSDSSGGNSHEIAFNDTGVFIRRGATTTWGSWERLYTTGNKPTASDVGLGNVENKSSATIRGELTSSNVTTALGYTPYNSTNPNGYTSNTGTVTKVTAGTGLSIGTTAGGNFTTTGTINHTNSVTAQTTQAVYPIKIDAQGHISAYGSAVTIPTVPSNIVNTITTTAGAHTAITNQKGNVSFNVPTTAAHVGAATSDHAHGNITNGGDITATAPTIASGDQIIINDNSASKVTNGPTFDGSTTTTALTPKGTWENFSKFSGSYNDLTNKPTIPSVAALLDVFYPVGTIYETTVDPDTFNPNNVWGGEWTRIKDKFLLSAGDTYTGGSSGGSSDAVVPSHTHSVSITSKGMSANASHSHNAPNTDYPNFIYASKDIQTGDMGSQSGSGRHYPFQSTTTAQKYWAKGTVTGSTSVAHTHKVTGDTGSTGVNTATVKNTNMPPYLVVYVWKREA